MKSNAPLNPDLDQTRRFLSVIMDPAVGCCELRVFSATYDRNGFVVAGQQYSRTLAGWYDDPDKLVADAARLRGVSGYVTVNPVKPDLLARADNMLMKAKHATADDDIVCLRWLFLDIDPVRPADISSTDEELAAALARRDLILGDNPDMARSSIWGCSGNGAWVLVRLPDYPNDPTHKSAIGRTLAVLGQRYSDDAVIVDATTKNPSRVMALAGTMKAKGSQRKERPWRMATIDTLKLGQS
jgi:hypothetical protein